MRDPDKTIHLIDDRRMGGVTRFLDRITEMRPQDEIRYVKRGSMRGHAYGAGTIVSHLAVSWRSLPMMITLRACNPHARIVHVEHSYCAGFEVHRVQPRRYGRFHALLRTVYALFDEVITVSENQAEWMRRIGVIPAGKVHVAPPLVDPFLSLPDSVPGEALRYGFVGRLDEQKGLDRIINAWRDVAPDEARLEIVGNGPMREALEAMAEGDARITFHGATSSPADAYRLFDIAVMPSRWEPFGLSCLEARAAGRPVLVAPVDGLPEQLSEGGGWVLEDDAEAWVRTFAIGMDSADIDNHVRLGRNAAARQARNARMQWSWLLDTPRMAKGALPHGQKPQTED